MKHAASSELYAYWQEKRGKRPAPERADIEPGAIRGALSDAIRGRGRDRAAQRRDQVRHARLGIAGDVEIRIDRMHRVLDEATRSVVVDADRDDLGVGFGDAMRRP